MSSRIPETTITTARHFTIPDFVSMFPFILRINPYYASQAKISYDWLDSFGVHPNTKHRDAFQAMDFGLLTAMCYPDADKASFRILCDYINALFAFDDLTDEGALRKDGDGTKKASDIVMNALCHPETYETSFKVGKVFSSFWGRALELGVSFGTQRRFIETTDLYVRAVHEQVVNRAKDKLLGIDDFIELRRDTGALKMCFAIGEFAMKLTIPDDVLEHASIKIMENCANDVVVLTNDIYSYNIEQAQGDTMNIIEAAMREKKFDVQGAVDFAGQLVKERVDLFVATKAGLPSWGDKIDREVQSYLQVCEDWMIGGIHWSLGSTRYFGAEAEKVRRTLRVELLPKQDPRGQEEITDLE
ncbi:hypothetical protein FRB90_004811 [Tulasnella sp. 427]|nr:hypothetical protein FRB90_004811 [Tulasnella sp. 427]